jgi:hypothetical protein
VSEALRDPRRFLARSRTRRLRAGHSYGSVLLLIAATFLFAAVASDAAWTSSVLLELEAVMLLAALWASGFVPSSSPTSFAVVAGAAVVAVVHALSGGDLFTGIVGILTGALVVATIVVLILGVLDQGEVNAQSVSAAICVYLLLGLFFMFVYGVVAVLSDGPFFAQGVEGTRPLRVYFSYVTLATLGYGDYTPAGDLGRSLAVTEAIVGQLYLVTVVALLVSRIGSAGRSSRPDDAARRDPA